jgi:hypothetical protein
MQEMAVWIYPAEYVGRSILPDQSADPLPSPLCFRFKGATNLTARGREINLDFDLDRFSRLY